MNRLAWTALPLALLTIVGLLGCGGDRGGGGGGTASESAAPASELGVPAPAPGSRGVIGVSLLTFQNPFFKVIADTITAEGGRQGYSVVALSADEDAARQSRQIQDFIVQKVSAIVLSPCEARAVVPAIRAANEAGIPVFTVDIPCREDGVEIVSQIATDNKGGGREAARAMIEAIGSGKIAIIHFQQAESCRLRVEGFREVIDEYNRTATQPIQIVAELEGGGAKDRGRAAAADALLSNPDLRGLFAINDPSALGAVAAVSEAQKAGQVVIIGFDGQPEGRRAIKAGTIYADPIQYPDRMGQEVVNAIVAHLSGKDVPPMQLIPTSLYRRAEAQADPTIQ